MKMLMPYEHESAIKLLHSKRDGCEKLQGICKFVCIFQHDPMPHSSYDSFRWIVSAKPAKILQ